MGVFDSSSTPGQLIFTPAAWNTNASWTLDFDYTISACDLSTFVFTSSILNTNYEVSDPLVTLGCSSIPTCNGALITYSALVLPSPGTSLPGAVTFDTSTCSFDIFTNDVLDVGMYDIQVTATMAKSDYGPSAQSTSFQFQLTISDPCRFSWFTIQ